MKQIASHGEMTEWSKVCDSSVKGLPVYDRFLISVSWRGFKSHFRHCFLLLLFAGSDQMIGFAFPELSFPNRSFLPHHTVLVDCPETLSSRTLQLVSSERFGIVLTRDH